MFDLRLAQSFMSENHIDGWLIYDFKGSNPVMWHITGKRRPTTRRNFIFIPSKGEPRMLLNGIDCRLFSDIVWKKDYFDGGKNMKEKLSKLIKGCKIIAMEYSSLGSIPTMSWVDAGMLELVRSLGGAQVCSSADLFQVAASTWSKQELDSQIYASKEVEDVKNSAFSFIRSNIKAGKTTTELMVQRFIVQEFQRKNLEYQDLPFVAVNENSGNPHYLVDAQKQYRIKRGDWVLIDLWARQPGESNVFSDITWVGYVGNEVPSEYLKIFQIVKKARDLVFQSLKNASETNDSFEGWELDMIARRFIQKKGYGKYFMHRTGHSLGPGAGVHGLGANLDNFETHDTRKVLPETGFSIEPGIYLPNFGVRLEINVFLSKKGPIVTSPIQNEVVNLSEG
jgi:Xaa-Pro aminopeptidase